jgi:rhodanese-related sulfurtransferase
MVPGVLLVDVREKHEWDAGHLEGALLLPLSRLRLASAGQLRRKLPRKKILYVHCRSGGRAIMAASLLRRHGYDARSLQAGFEALRQAGFSAAK